MVVSWMVDARPGNKEEAELKPYQAPVLVTYGRVSDLTHTGAGKGNENPQKRPVTLSNP